MVDESITREDVISVASSVTIRHRWSPEVKPLPLADVVKVKIILTWVENGISDI